MDNVIEKIEKFLCNSGLLVQDKVFLVAFSGGADSLCLLDVLSKLSDKFQFKVYAAHLNHGWRIEADDEEEIARKYCKDNNISFLSEKLPFGIPKTELEARNRRYDFLERMADKIKANAIFTGHTLTDQAETILYRLIKGAGIKGIKGIPEKRFLGDIEIYRPMLDIEREETVKYCRENDLKPCFDTSNEDISYQRNKIRLKLIPELKTYNTEIETSLVRLGKIAEDSEEIIQEYLNEKKHIFYLNDNEINTEAFIKASNALRRRLIYNLLASNNIEYNFERIEQIIIFIENNKNKKSGETYSIAKDKWIFCSKKEIKLIGSVGDTVIKSAIEARLNDTVIFSPLSKTVEITEWSGGNPEMFPGASDNSAFVDLSNIKMPLYLRTREAGDRIQPLGMKEKVRLKKYLINKGIPQHERDKLLLLTNEEEVLWVIGVGLSELIKVKTLPTHIIRVY